MTKYFIAVLILLSSCSSIKQAEKKLDKYRDLYPELFDADTISTTTFEVIERLDTLYITDFQIDTTVLIENRDSIQIDTIIVEKQGIRTRVISEKTRTITKYEIETRIDSFMQEVTITDTIFVEKTTIKEEVNFKHRGIPWWWWLVLILIVGLIGLNRLSNFLTKITRR